MIEETMFQPTGPYVPAPNEGPPIGPMPAQPKTAAPTYQSDSQYSSDNVASNISSQASNTYQLKTMCLARKMVQMPTKEEHGFLLFCGLGARRWQCAIDCNSLTFKQAILNIYPRLRSVIGYNLWTLTKDKKTFERIPEKVNTPVRIRSYLGSHFTGCLIIVPVSDIVLMEERREHLRQRDIKDDKIVGLSQNASNNYLKHDQAPRVAQKEPEHQGSYSQRSLCLICGRIEKTAGTGTFHKILEEKMPVGQERQSIAKKLNDILGFNFEQSQKKFIASTEICRKCLRTVSDVVRMEEQLKSSKEELVSSFFSTTSKFNKNYREGEEPKISQARGHHNGDFNTNSISNNYSHPFLQRSLPLPIAFFNQQIKPANHNQGPAHGPGLVQFYHQTPGYSANHSGGANPESGSHPCRTENKAGSDYGSEVGSSSFISVSPTPRLDHVPSYRDQETESLGGSISPRPFDNRSYASTFSFRSTNSSMMSKAKNMAYDESVPNRDERTREEEAQRREIPENRSLPKGDSRDQQVSPVSQGETSPRFSGSPTSSLESNTPPGGTSPTPGEDFDRKAEEEREERRKPWKKRKRAHESDPENSSGFQEVKKVKEDSNESENCQNQLDNGTSDQY